MKMAREQNSHYLTFIEPSKDRIVKHKTKHSYLSKPVSNLGHTKWSHLDITLTYIRCISAGGAWMSMDIQPVSRWTKISFFVVNGEA